MKNVVQVAPIMLLSNKPTEMLTSWDNPYNGFSIHIHKNEHITIYGLLLLTKGLPDKKTRPMKRSINEVKKMADALHLFGNPGGIFIASEGSLKNSKVIHELLKEIFVPSIQIFCLRKIDEVE
ncbi:MAG: hypothetical protein QM496_18220 [Verrucomicrobiota bacterium]